jgi:hypothetical protein
LANSREGQTLTYPVAWADRWPAIGQPGPEALPSADQCRASSKGTEKSEQSRAITGLSPSLASYSKLLFVPLLDHGLPLQPVPKERDLGREARPLADPRP